MLKLAANLPVISCECERSFPFYDVWLIVSMTTKELSSLAVINIRRGVQIDYKRAVKILHPRKLNVSNLMFNVNMLYLYIY